MKNHPDATHSHKRAGAVVVLESTGELAKVMVPTSGDEFWVKSVDLTELVAGAVKKASSSKKVKEGRPNASANTKYRVVRVA